MNLVNRFRRIIGSLVRSGRLDREMDEEFRFHLEKQIEDNVKAGMSLQQARHAALRGFGGVEQIKEECRDTRAFALLRDFGQDLRYGLRMARKNPGFTLVAVLTLALGIGANTAIFSLVDAVLLRMLPVEDPQELVLLGQRVGPQLVRPFATSQFRGLREGSEVFAGLCAFRPYPGAQVEYDGESELAFGQLVSGDYYSVLGVRALVGRTISDSDDQAPGQHPVVVLSYDYWQGRFGGRSDIVGQTIGLQGRLFTVVGVTPREFFGTEPGRAVEITVPLAMQPVLMPGIRPDRAKWLILVGRLKSGISEKQARARLNVLWARLMAEESPGSPPITATLDLQPGAQGLNGLRQRFSLPLRILLAAVGLVLLIACANLAGLLLARAMARRHEIDVRLALGASRMRLVRQLLTETVLLAVMGGIAGAVVACWAVGAIVTMMSRGADPIVLNLAPDLRGFAFTGGVSILAGLLFGVLPALRITDGDVGTGLKGGSPVVAGARNRWAQSLVVFQVALSLLLVGSATLFVRTLQKLLVVDAGFQKANVLLLNVRPGASGYRGARGTAIREELYARFSAAPGVQAVTFSMDTPLGGLSYAAGISVPGRSPNREDDHVPVYFNFVGPRFFETLGIPILSGRDFNDRDDDGVSQVAVINESLARHYFRNQNPLGKSVLIDKQHVEIVGIARDSRYESLREPAPQMIYRPFMDKGGMTFCVRTSSDPLTLVPHLRAEMRAVGPNLLPHSMTTLEQKVDAALVQERMLATLSGYFGVLGLILVSVGSYGVLAYSVVRRTREIGVRMALGASPSSVLRLVLGEAMRLAFSGLRWVSWAHWSWRGWDRA